MKRRCMGRKANRSVKWIGISSFIGYFVGTTLFVLIGGKGEFDRALFGLGGAMSLALVVGLLIHFRNPGLNLKINQLKEDERLQWINAKSTSMTLYIMYGLLLVISIVGIYMDNLWIHYGAVGIFLLIYVVNTLIKLIYERKL